MLRPARLLSLGLLALLAAPQTHLVDLTIDFTRTGGQ
jgi:hypothetical protein